MTSAPKARTSAGGRPKWLIPAAIVLAPVLLVVLLIWALAFAAFTVCLHLAIWTWWCARGRDVLFVYSDSPIWRGYIDDRILPLLGGRALVLNWSARKHWRPSLGRMAFYHFSGSREFNPLAVVFRPFRRTRTFRFWQPFRDFKHGHPEALHAVERDLFGLIGVPEGQAVASRR